MRTEHGKFSFSNKDGEIGRQLFLYKNFDFEKVNSVKRLLSGLGYLSKNGGYLIDVGANVGTVCIPLVREGAFARALAFEPAPRNYSLLVKNINQNGLSAAIRSFNCALSSAETVLQMELSADNYGDHRIRTQSPSQFSNEQFTESGRRLINIRGCRLDDVLRDLQVPADLVNLLWLDVQGHEKQVMEGAQSVIAAGVPVIAEFWPYGLARTGVSPHEFSSFISGHFTSFYDLNMPSPTAVPAQEIEVLFPRYQGISFTDLLLLSK